MNQSMFDILGPVMIGPSSSHTAGAQRIGKAMYQIAGENITSVSFYLHGSFHLTLRGHGTDRALVGGILGMDSCDPNIREALSIAESKGLKFSFHGADLGDVHPNTVKVIAQTSEGKTYSLVGSSIGGADIEIVEINGVPSKFSGKFPSAVMTHQDVLGIVSHITGVFAANHVNIVTVLHSRENKGKASTTMIETDGKITLKIQEEIRRIETIRDVIVMEQIV